MLSKDEIDEIVKEYVEQSRNYIQEEYATTRRVLNPETYEGQLNGLVFRQEELKKLLAYHDRNSVYPIVDSIFKSKGLPVDWNSDSYQWLANEILKAQIRLIEYEIEQAKTGGLNDSPAVNVAGNLSSPVSFPAASPSPTPIPEVSSEVFSKIAKEYWDENSPEWKVRTKPENQTFHKKLLEFIGADRQIYKVDYETAREYKKLLSETITKRKKVMSKTRVDMYLGYASQVFKWAKQHHYTEVNPFEGIQYGKKHRKRADKQKKKFSKNDLKLLFVESRIASKKSSALIQLSIPPLSFL